MPVIVNEEINNYEIFYSLSRIWYGLTTLFKSVIEYLFYSDESWTLVLVYCFINVRDPSQNGRVDGVPTYFKESWGFWGRVIMTGKLVG